MLNPRAITSRWRANTLGWEIASRARGARSGSATRFEEEGERASGDKAAALLDQAVQAFRSALEVYTKADLPQDWADSANQSRDCARWTRESGRAETRLPPCSIKRCRRFAVRSRSTPKPTLPQDWARTQSNLGIALWNEGERASGDKAVALLDQAVQAYRSALEVYTKADLPQDWAATQNNLGTALMDEGERASGDKAAALFDQAAQAYRSALEVFTKADLPQDWANTQNNLGNALEDEAERASGDKATALLRSGGAGVSQRARGRYQSRSAAGLGQDAK